MNLLLTSCVEEPEAPQIEVNENAQIARVKSWFEDNKTKLRLPEKGSNFRSESQELILPFFEKEPDWDKFHHYYFPDGREVFEISLENATKYFPTNMVDSFPNRNPAEVVIQNIMFVKHQSMDRFDPLIARYYPANSSNEKFFEEINYQAIDYDWSGTLELFTYDEHHFVGFEIVEGEVIRNYTYSPHDGNNIEGLRIMDMGCTTHYYPVGYKSCVDGYCTTTINYYIAETSCPGGGDLGTSYSYGFPTGDSSSSGSGGGTAGYNPPDVPNPEIQDPEEKRKSQLDYLRNHGESEFVDLIEKLLSIKGISHYEVLELNNLVNKIYLEVKGKFMMGIFSPENIGQILLLAFSSNVSNEFRNTIFNSIPRYSAYNEIYLLIGNKSWNINGVVTTFTGYTSHGTLSYGISKGFTPSLIRSILNNGTAIRVPYQNGYQLRILYQYEGRTVGIVIDSNVGTQNFGKIVTYLTNY